MYLTKTLNSCSTNDSAEQIGPPGAFAGKSAALSLLDNATSITRHRGSHVADLAGNRAALSSFLFTLPIWFLGMASTTLSRRGSW